jgi:hypothetical protein
VKYRTALDAGLDFESLASAEEVDAAGAGAAAEDADAEAEAAATGLGVAVMLATTRYGTIRRALSLRMEAFSRRVATSYVPTVNDSTSSFAAP